MAKKKDAEPTVAETQPPVPPASEAPPETIVVAPDGEIVREARHPNLASALSAVMKDVDYVRKKRAPNLNYTFASEADIVGVLHQAFAEHGLTLIPSRAEVVKSESYQTAKGTAMSRSIILMTYRLLHVSGESVEGQMLGEGADVGDKSIPKALTCAYKYFLREAAMLGTGDDPERQSSDEQARRPERSNGTPTRDTSAGDTPKPSLDDQYRQALSAVAKADGEDKLNRYEQAIRRRPFTPEQIRKLQGAVDQRRKALLPPPAADTPQEDEIAF